MTRAERKQLPILGLIDSVCDSIRIQYGRDGQAMPADMLLPLEATERDSKDVWADLTGGRERVECHPTAMREYRDEIARISVVLEREMPGHRVQTAPLLYWGQLEASAGWLASVADPELDNTTAQDEGDRIARLVLGLDAAHAA